MTMALIAFMRLFVEFRASSWDAWREVLALLTEQVREAYIIAGRGSGKSRITALIATWYATRKYKRVPGEYIFIGVFAPDKRQAGVTFRYVVGLLRSVPELNALIEAETRGSVTLRNGVVLEVIAATTAAPRGRAYALAIVEEAAFLPHDSLSANPDAELLRALRPALARVPGSLLMVVSSPYARRGILFEASERNRKKPTPEVLVVQRATSALNPSFDAGAIQRAYEDDPTSAAAEYGAAFRSDVESFLNRDALMSVVMTGRHELPPMSRYRYRAFIDPSGGSNDSMTLAIAHTEDHKGIEIEILDLLREVRPPFSPEAVVEAFATDMRQYRVNTALGDHYAGEWPREAFRRHGIHYQTSDLTKSDIYRDLLPLVNSGRLELLDEARLLSQLLDLERKVARSGKDSIDHGPGGHDDVANAAAGAVVKAKDVRGGFAFGEMPGLY